jgi:hypothetical protein
MKEFIFSEDYRKVNRLLFILFPVTAVCMFGFALFLSGFRFWSSLAVTGTVLIIMSLLYAVEIPLLKRSMRGMKVLVDDERLIKQCGKRHNTVLWENICKIKLREDPKGHLGYIELHQKNKKTIWLGGFNEMDVIADFIKDKISDDVLIETKRQKFAQNTLLFVVLIAFGTTAVLVIIASMGDMAFESFSMLCSFCMGFWLLIYRPLTKINLRWKWWEIVLALISLACGISLLLAVILG